MGCSLCSLQKPEEQYKLLYEVCQVTTRCLFSCGSARALTWLSVTSGEGIGDFCACVYLECDSLSDVSAYFLLSLLGDFLFSGT